MLGASNLKPCPQSRPLQNAVMCASENEMCNVQLSLMLRSSVSNSVRLESYFEVHLSSFLYWWRHTADRLVWALSLSDSLHSVKKYHLRWAFNSFLVWGYPSLLYMPHCRASLDPTELWSNIIETTVILSLTAENSKMFKMHNKSYYLKTKLTVCIVRFFLHCIYLTATVTD